MAIKTRKLIGFPGRGVKVTKKNIIELGELTGGDVSVKIDKAGVETDHKLKLKTKQGWRVAFVGDVLVKDAALKRFYVIKAANFAGYFVA